MIKANYDPQTTLVKGYYPNSITYASIPEPFIEIESSAQILGKQMCVIDGVYQEYIEPLEVQLSNAKASKIAELNAFHNSEAVRKLTINSTYAIFLTGEYRTLVAEQIRDIELQIAKGLVAEASASFNYYYNGDDSYIPVSYSQLQDILIEMMRIVNANFVQYKTHNKNIKELTTLDEVSNYDFTAGYLTNQNINL